jgi:hypothetical protein
MAAIVRLVRRYGWTAVTGLIVTGFLFFLLWRTTPSNETAGPYAVFRFVPGSVQLVHVEDKTGDHDELLFSLKLISKDTSCDQVRVRKVLSKVGASDPYHQEEYWARELAPAGESHLTRAGGMALDGQLPEGVWVVNIIGSCFHDEAGALKQIGTSAGAQACFVNETRSTRSGRALSGHGMELTMLDCTEKLRKELQLP